MKKRIRLGLAVLLAAVCAVSGALLLRDLLRASREREADRQLAQQVQTAREAVRRLAEEDPAADPDAPVYAESGVLLQYDGVYQQNHDMAGWLCAEGIDVDLPVMYTPDDPEHYLRRAFDGSSAVSGCLFLGPGWSPDGEYAIIYGHEMNDGSMFGNLDSYASADYAREHPVIQFDTLTEQREYRILAAFYSRVYAVEEEGVFRYYRYTSLSDPAVFEEYIAQVKEAALYDTGVAVEYGDRILSLSTCSSHTRNGRFVVVAVERGTH